MRERGIRGRVSRWHAPDDADAVQAERAVEEYLSTPRVQMLYLGCHLAHLVNGMVCRAEATGESEVLGLLLETDAAVGRMTRRIFRGGEPRPRRRAVWRRDVQALRSDLALLREAAAAAAGGDDDPELAALMAATRACVDRLGEKVATQWQ